MKSLLTFILALFVILKIAGQELSEKDLNNKPTNLNEAIEQLKIIHQDSTKQKIMAMTEDEFMGGAHFGLGMWMRNSWGLWKGNELAKYFNSIGIFHPDDMSGIILTSYYRELHGQDWDLDNQVKYYLDYWEKSNEHFKKLETDTAYRREIQVQQDSVQQVAFEQKKNEWSQGKRVSGYVDHRCGFLKDFVLRTKIEGTIVKWENDMLLIKIDKFDDERKKKRVIKCYNVQNDIIMIEKGVYFRLINEEYRNNTH